MSNSSTFEIKRATTADVAFQSLVHQNDDELWNEFNEDQSTYDQHNKVPNIETAIIVVAEGKPASCGCFKVYNNNIVEIK